jgi:hypothetical protein
MAVRLSPEQAAKLGLGRDGVDAPCPPGRNKFHARRTPCAQGHVHASAGEALRCNQLALMERAGEIRKLEQQPKFYFVFADGRRVTDERGAALRYTADFRYDEAHAGVWRAVVEDFKSRATMTEAATLRLAFFRAFHPDIDLRLSGTGGNRKGKSRGR